MRRNFNRGGFKSYNNNSSNFNSRDRRGNDRDDDFRAGSSYKRQADRRDSSREFGDKKFRRNFDNSSDNQFSRSSYNNNNNQDRRDGGSFSGGNRSFHGRNQNFRDNKSRRSPSPPPRFNKLDDKRSDSRRDFRQRSLTPPKFRDRSDNRRPAFRPQTGRIRKAALSLGSRIRRRPEILNRLTTGKNQGGTGSREYLKRMKEARSKLNDESRQSESGDEEKKDEENDEAEVKSKHDENDEDFLDIGNDVDLEDDGEASTSKPKDDKKSDETENQEDNDESQKTAEKSDKESLKTSIKPKRESIEFDCPHCDMKTTSIREYLQHLKRSTHMRNLRALSEKVRLTLNNLRKLQRARQFQIETTMEKVEDIPSKYCQICKLYYRQSKLEHRASEDHKKIRNFLHPYCKVCETRFMATLKYEEHRCSVGHLKMKARRAEIDEEDDFDMNNSFDIGDFKTVDSIGDVDGEEDDSQDDAGDTPVGHDFVSTKQVLFCDLCNEVVTFELSEDDETLINEHCKTRRHNKLYRKTQEKDTSKNLQETIENESKEDVPSTSNENVQEDCESKIDENEENSNM